MDPIVVSLSALTPAVELVGKRKTNDQKLKLLVWEKGGDKVKNSSYGCGYRDPPLRPYEICGEVHHNIRKRWRTKIFLFVKKKNNSCAQAVNAYLAGGLYVSLSLCMSVWMRHTINQTIAILYATHSDTKTL